MDEEFFFKSFNTGLINQNLKPLVQKLYIEIIIQNKYKVLIYPKQKIFDLRLLKTVDNEVSEEILMFNQKYSSYIKESVIPKSKIPKSMTEESGIEESGALIIHIYKDIYFLITSLVFRIKYEHEIKELIFENYLISIISTKGLLTIVKDHYDNYFCVEIDSYFEKRTKEKKIAKILNDKKHRYIPCLEVD